VGRKTPGSLPDSLERYTMKLDADRHAMRFRRIKQTIPERKDNIARHKTKDQQAAVRRHSTPPSTGCATPSRLQPAQAVARRHPLRQIRPSRYLNNHAENSHQPTRPRERAMKRFKSLRPCATLFSGFRGTSANFRLSRHLLSGTQWRTEIADRFALWCQVTALDAAPECERPQAVPSLQLQNRPRHYTFQST
jgi:hypothetical protein